MKALNCQWLWYSTEMNCFIVSRHFRGGDIELAGYIKPQTITGCNLLDFSEAMRALGYKRVKRYSNKDNFLFAQAIPLEQKVAS